MSQNTSLTTTGLKPQTIGSVRTFLWSANLNGLAWDISGGSATLILQDPNGNQTIIAGTIDSGGYSARAHWVVTAPAGNWTLSWKVQDAAMALAGTYENSVAVTFEVQATP